MGIGIYRLPTLYFYLNFNNLTKTHNYNSITDVNHM
jgi:hypothetical protein